MMQILEEALLLPRFNVYSVRGACLQDGHDEEERG